MNTNRKFFLFIISNLLPIGALPCNAQSIHFTDVTQNAGIHFRYNFGDSTYENILESSGAGVTIFDYDNDGDMDLYLLNGTYLPDISDSTGYGFRNTPNQFYQNNGNGTFTEIAASAGLDDRHWSMAAAPVDYDLDGDIDLFLLNFGPNVFFENNGDGTFSDITRIRNVQGPKKLNGFTKWSVSLACWDYNRDGLLDFMIGNFLAFDPQHISPTFPDMMPHPSEYRGQASMLLRQSPAGSFSDATRSAGLYYPEAKCMGLTVFDFDDDGDLDLFQGNDHQNNFLFRMDSDGKFHEMAVASGVAANDQGLPTGSMHGSIGDIDGDGLIDLLVTDLRYGALYRNLGGGIFEDITRKSGIAAAFKGKGQWAALLCDFDDDGDLDIFSANGTAEALKLQLPLLLQNYGRSNFQDVGRTGGSYFRNRRSGRGAATVDFDNDGDLDILVSHVDLQAKPALLRNDSETGNHWIVLLLISHLGETGAIGAKISVFSAVKKQVFINQNAMSYLSYSDPRLHIGLGQSIVVDSLKIRWPAGANDKFYKIKADRYLKIVQSQGIQN